MSEIKKIDKYWQRCDVTGILNIADETVKWCNHFWELFGNFLES